MAREQKPVDVEIGIVHQYPHHLRHGLVAGQQQEVRDLVRLRLGEGAGDGGDGGLEPDRKEDHSQTGVVSRHLERIPGRVHDLHPRPFGTRLLEAHCARRDPHQITKGADHRIREHRQREGAIEVIDRRHAHGTAGTGDQTHVLRHQPPQTCARHAVSVGPANLHDGQPAVEVLGLLPQLAEQPGHRCWIRVRIGGHSSTIASEYSRSSSRVLAASSASTWPMANPAWTRT